MRVESEITVAGVTVSVRGDIRGGEWSDVEYSNPRYTPLWVGIHYLGKKAEQAALEALQDDWTRFERDMEAQDA